MTLPRVGLCKTYNWAYLSAILLSSIYVPYNILAFLIIIIFPNEKGLFTQLSITESKKLSNLHTNWTGKKEVIWTN